MSSSPTPTYPSAFHRKVLAQEAPGGDPVTLNIVLPSITKPGQPFDARIAILDETGYPSLTCDGTLHLELPDHAPAAIPFQRGAPAVGSLAGIRIAEEGLFRLRGTLNELVEYSNPTLCTAADLPGIYWGDPHVHTILSRCHSDKCRSMNFCFTAARHMTGLDWVAAADHVSNGRCDISKWREQACVSNLYDDPPAFATLPAYEASLSGGCGGDNNVYMSRFPEEYVDEHDNGNTTTLCEGLAGKLPRDEFFIVPHHTTRTGKHGEIPDDIYPGPAAMPVVEIHSKWGTSEYRGNPNPLKDIHPGPSTARDLLNRGLQLGFVAGTDTHATMPSGGGREPEHIDRLPGLTAAQCPSLNRQSVFEALRGRHCYAASLERILLQGRIAGRGFGELLRFRDLSGAPQIDVTMAAKSDIVKVDVVRNGEPVYTVEPKTWQTRLSYTEPENPERVALDSKHLGRFVYYYVRVTCASGAQAWSSPVWIAD